MSAGGTSFQREERSIAAVPSYLDIERPSRALLPRVPRSPGRFIRERGIKNHPWFHIALAFLHHRRNYLVISRDGEGWRERNGESGTLPNTGYLLFVCVRVCIEQQIHKSEIDNPPRTTKPADSPSRKSLENSVRYNPAQLAENGRENQFTVINRPARNPRDKRVRKKPKRAERSSALTLTGHNGREFNQRSMIPSRRLALRLSSLSLSLRSFLASLAVRPSGESCSNLFRK